MNPDESLAPTDEAIKRAVTDFAAEQSRLELGASVQSAIDANPDKEAYVQQLAKRAKMPLSLVKGNEAAVEREVKLDELNLTEINTKYPTLSSSLKNQDFATITNDEIDNLKAIEDIAPTLLRGNSSMFEETAAGFEQQSASVAMLGSAFGLGDDADIADFIVARSKAAAAIQKRAPAHMRQYYRDMQFDKSFFGQMEAAAKNPRAVARMTATQAPSNLALPIVAGVGGSAAGSAVAPGIGTVVGGGAGLYSGSAFLGVASELNQALNERGVDLTDRNAVLSAISTPEFKEDIKLRAARYGLTMAAVDVMFGGVAGRFISAAKGGTMVAKTVATAKDLGVQTVGEGASEAAGQLSARGDVSGGDVFNEMVAGLGMSAVETAAGARIRKEVLADDTSIKAAAEQGIAQKDADITALNEYARNTKLAQRNPDMLKDFVEKAAPGQKLFIDAAAANEFFQSLPPESKQAITGVMPDIEKKIRDAVATGSDVEMARSDYFAYVAPDSRSDYLKSFIKFAEEDMSIDQLSHIDDIIADHAEDFNASDNQGLEFGELVEKRIERELRNAGRSNESARFEAQLARSNAETLLARYGDSNAAYKIISDAYSKLSIAGVEDNKARRSKITDLDFVINSARKEATGEKRPPALTPEQKYPALSFIKRRTGGIKSSSPLATELKNLGVTSQTLPGLFKGRYSPAGMFGGGSSVHTETSIDNIPVTEWDVSDTPPQDGNGYVDPAHVLEAIREELAGNPLKSRSQLKNQRDEDALIEALDKLGIDITKATNDEIKQAFAGAQQSEMISEDLFQTTFGDEKARGSIQLFPDGKTIINVFEKADLSTVLHEMGHFYWNIFDKLNEANALGEQGAKDWQAIREFVNAKEGVKLTVIQEEKIARAFEAYLMEGKAPSVDLQQAFQRFKAWLLGVYRSVARLNVSINDDVRQVFDRMLASDEAINDVRDSRLFRPDSNVLSILNDEEKNKYIAQGERSAGRAKEKLFRRMLKDYKRTNTQWWKEEREKLRTEIEGRVNKSAVYIALDAMQKGEMPDGTPLGDPVRFNASMFREQFGREALEYMPRATIAKSGGIDPNVAAEMFGFKSADQMVKAIINAEPKKQKIERLIDEEMLSRHGDTLNDGTVERAAIEDFHNEMLAQQLATELKAASEKAGVPYATPAEFKAAAAQMLGSRKIDDITRVSKFYNAEVRAARDFGKYSRAGSWEKAADAKRRQLLNHYLFKLANESNVEIARALKDFKRLEKPPVSGKVKIDEDYHNKIREVLAAFNFMPRMSAKKELRLELQAFAKWIEEKKANDDAQLDLPPELLRATDRTHYRDMTLDEFRAVRDMVANIEIQGRRKREYTINGEKRDFQEVVDRAIVTAEAALPALESPMNKSAAAELGEKFMSVHVKPREYFRQLDGGELGVFHEAIMSPIDKAMDRHTTREREASKAIEELVTAHYDNSTLRAIMRDKMDIQGLGSDMTKENLLMVALNWGNQGNREAVLHGYQARGWDFDTVEKALVNNLDKNDWDFVQGVWDWIGSYWPEISALEKSRKGFTPKSVDATAISTPYGKVKGGYFPIVADPSKASISNAQTIEEYTKDFKSGMFAGAQTRRNHTIARVGVGLEARPLLLSFDVIPRHVSLVLRDIELSEAVFNASKLIRNKDVRRVVSERIGIEGYNAVDLWLKDVAVGNVASRDFISIVLNKLRANSSVMLMGFNLGTMVQQATGVGQAAAAMGNGGKGWKWVFHGFSKLINAYTRGHGLNISEIHNMSEFMRNRHETMNRDINEALNVGRGLAPDVVSRTYEKYSPEALQRVTDKIPNDYRKYFLWHIQKAQMLVDAGIWIGAYDKALSEDVDATKAAEIADSVVRRSQASGLMQDLSGIERGTVSHGQRQSAAYKTAFSFMYSYFNAKFNISYGKIADYRAGRINKGELAVDMINIIWLESLLSAIIMQNFPGDEEDEIEDSARKWAWWFVSQPAQQVVMGREITSAMQGFQSGNGGFGVLLQSTGKLSKQVEQGEADYGLLKSGIGFAGVAIGLPATQINRFINVIERTDNGEEVGYIDFVRSRKPDEK